MAVWTRRPLRLSPRSTSSRRFNCLWPREPPRSTKCLKMRDDRLLKQVLWSQLDNKAQSFSLILQRRHGRAILGPDPLIISLKEVCLLYKMGVRNETHIKLGGRFHCRTSRRSRTEQMTSIKVPLPFMSQRKNTLMSFHVSIFHITSLRI